MPRDYSRAAGLRMEVHDPLWLLARQWQFGELRGEDAGSPVWVAAEGSRAPLTRIRPGQPDGAPGLVYEDRQPLEERVEAEPLAAGQRRPLRWAATAGLRFLALLDEEDVGGYAQRYRDVHRYELPGPAELDRTARCFRAVVAGRAIDGTALHDDLQAAGAGLPDVPQIRAEDVNVVTRAVNRFKAWYAALAGPATTPTWAPDRFEYQFAVASPLADPPRVETVLTVTEYDQGRIDWSSFNLASAESALGAADDGSAVSPFSSAGLPSPVAFRGMPAARLWQFEDAAVDFGDLSSAPEDLTQLLLIDFALLHGNDHYLLPIDVPVGSLCRVEQLVATDTFGVDTTVPHVSVADQAAAEAAGRPVATFRLFELGSGAARSSLFFLPPALGLSLEGPPLEEVRLLRDEGANLGWAVEVRAAYGSGFPIDRADAEPAQQADPSPAPAAPQEPLWRYQLRTPVPEHWFPLVPVVERPGTNHLERGTLLRHDGTPAPPPWGRVLTELTDVAIPEEELTRATSRIVRAWQYARWTDGRQHAWIGRRRQPVGGVGDSGLRFDVLN